MVTRAVLLVIAVLAAAAGLNAQTPLAVTQQLAPSEQKVFEPGYAIGDVSVGDPKIADFRVVANRRSVMIIGKAAGTTTLILWDQQRRRRHEIAVTVARRETDTLETQLRGLLTDFPSVDVRRLGTSLVLTGSVSSKEDLQAIERIAGAARVSSAVRFVPPTPALALPSDPAPPATGAAAGTSGTTPAPGTPAGKNPPPVAAPPPPSGVVRPPAPATATAPGKIVYEIELLEASSRFRTGSYATGIEPSGRRLYKGTLTVDVGTQSEVFIGGKALVGAPGTAKGGKGKVEAKPSGSGQSREVETGIRLYVTPEASDTRGRFKSLVTVETNLPLDSDLYDPETWRRARFDFSARPGEPFAITGGDLLATPDAAASSNAIRTATRTTSRVAQLPGVPDVPGLSAVPIFGSLFGSRNYRSRQTQLLVIMRPMLESGRGQ